MVTVLKNECGYVFAYCEWWICNVNGFIEENGKYCQIREMWIHKSARPSSFNSEMSSMRDLVLLMNRDPLMQSAEWVYWTRRKYDRQSKLYSRKQLVRFFNKGDYNGK